MTTFHMVGSLLVGILAWLFACAAIWNKKSDRAHLFSCGSFCMCAISLLLQLLEVKYLVGIRDFSAIEDTIHAVVFAACMMVGMTVVLNAAAVIRAYGKQ